ncbi:MAG TPA: thioredoxin domain-containing protein [Terracidiphilus sp.]|nr:thioredoxin domain-containing protein [Terracidiphilus sp.]
MAQSNLLIRIPSRAHVSILALACVALFAAAAAQAQSANAQFNDNPALRPPPDARVAIVEFDDLQCPACAHANPLLARAAAKYKIPWIRHDFIIPYHTWSRNAAVRARWFDTRSKTLGDQYRNEVFANQASIYNRNSLAEFTSQFAQQHGISLPFALDPEGKLSAMVDADVALGRAIGIHLTPSIFIVSNSAKTPYIYVQNPDQDLYRDIDRAFSLSHPVESDRETRSPRHTQRRR